MTDLGTLGGPNSEAFDINARGAVVGRPTRSSGPRAFHLAERVMTDLTTLLPAGSGWVLHRATGISEGGQIVGSGTLNGVARRSCSLRQWTWRCAAGGGEAAKTATSPRRRSGRRIHSSCRHRGARSAHALRRALDRHADRTPRNTSRWRRYDGDLGDAEERRISARTVTSDCRLLMLSASAASTYISIRTTAPGPFPHVGVQIPTIRIPTNPITSSRIRTTWSR